MSATSSGRRRRAGAARTMAQIMELQWLAPAVMSRRLALSVGIRAMTSPGFTSSPSPIERMAPAGSK